MPTPPDKLPSDPSPPNASPHPAEGLTRREPGPWTFDTQRVTPDKTTRTQDSAQGEPTPAAPSTPATPQPTSPGTTGGASTSGNLPQGLQGRYRLVSVLGKGGFANVYLAHDSVLDQDVAIKILKLGLASQGEQDRFLFEARIGAKLRHPNIISVLDIIQSAEGLQMIMEYCPGGTLGDRIKKKGPLRALQAIDVARQVAHALGYAHRRNYVHRDVKPANIFMAGEGFVKLGDFGIAAYTDLHEFTQTGMIIGTPLYMAPEQASDSRSVDPRADVYSLGLTLYYALTARSPRVLDLDIVPAAFRSLIKQATRPDRNDRLVSCDQFIAVLDKIEAELKKSGSDPRLATPVPVVPLAPTLALDTPTPTSTSPTAIEEQATTDSEAKATASTVTRETTASQAPVPQRTIRVASLGLIAAGAVGTLVLVAALIPILRPNHQNPGDRPPPPEQTPNPIVASPNGDTHPANGMLASAPTPSPTPASTPSPTASPTPTPSPTASPTPSPTPVPTAPLPRPTPPPVGQVPGRLLPLREFVAEMLKNPDAYDKTLVNTLKLWNDATTEIVKNKNTVGASILFRSALDGLNTGMKERPTLHDDPLAMMLSGLLMARLNMPESRPRIVESFRANMLPGGKTYDLRPMMLKEVFQLSDDEEKNMAALQREAARGPGGGPIQERFQDLRQDRKEQFMQNGGPGPGNRPQPPQGRPRLNQNPPPNRRPGN